MAYQQVNTFVFGVPRRPLTESRRRDVVDSRVELKEKVAKIGSKYTHI